MALTKVIGDGLGAIPAISGANLTELVGGLVYNGGTTLGALRIQTGTATTPSSSTDAGTGDGTSAQYYNTTTVSLSGFASAPTVFASIVGAYHEAVASPINSVGTSSVVIYARAHRTAAIQGITIHYIAIGTAS
jgi:hypothetical protein